MGRAPGPLTLPEEDRQLLASWAADCAERVLVLFESKAPKDRRPRAALDGARAFARGALRIGPARALAAAAHAAARDVDDPAAVAAARAAGHAAAAAHMGAHARGVAYAAIAAGLAAGGDPEAMAREARWQLKHAPAAVRAVLRKLPPPARAAGELGALVAALDAKLRSNVAGVNRAWHERHPMPRKATTAQRIAWHVDHQTACGCRPIPKALKAQMR